MAWHVILPRSRHWTNEKPHVAHRKSSLFRTSSDITGDCPHFATISRLLNVLSSIVETSVLIYSDLAQAIQLDTDASNEAVSARTRTTAEQEIVNHFRPYLYKREFRLRTDHAPWYGYTSCLYRPHRTAKWLESSSFNILLEHRARMLMGSAAVQTGHNVWALRTGMAATAKRS